MAGTRKGDGQVALITGASGGIGLDLLGRICEHLGWRLSIDSVAGQGTVGRLQLGPVHTTIVV